MDDGIKKTGPSKYQTGLLAQQSQHPELCGAMRAGTADVEVSW